MLELEQHLCFAVYSTAHMFNRLYGPMLEKLDLTYPQYLVVVLLCQHDRQSVGSLGKKLKLDSSTLTPLLKRLEKRGLVCRTRDTADERVVLVELTHAGRKIGSKLPVINHSIADAIGLSERDRNAILKTLLVVRDHLEEAAG
jgi:DNA-binding MarR family transcriptional regulator